MFMINKRMPRLSYHVGGPESMARKSQLIDELIQQIPDLIEAAKNDKTYFIEDHVRNYYLDGVIDQLNDILEYIVINKQ